MLGWVPANFTRRLQATSDKTIAAGNGTIKLIALVANSPAVLGMPLATSA